MTDPLTRERVEFMRAEANRRDRSTIETITCGGLVELCTAFLALEDARAEIARLRGSLSYIRAQARAGHSGALTVIASNADHALNGESEAVIAALARARAALE